ncbi:hypothetical protein [Actinomadura sp. 6K520]|uniref:hypothetical protein n=1 Tax=Actinomadura sp. 6K520 TaxID=2530364 RepID=UPI00104E5685|nr:hypothetical protein [Actinomadura sp. 6K520]TDE32624.1 hypothetical protein E1289_15050 [Actinomadura sp. 6K520]
MNEPVALLLLRHLFPDWAITRGREGTWRAAGRTLISSSDLDGLLEMLTVADPDAARRAVRLLKERPSAAP